MAGSNQSFGNAFAERRTHFRQPVRSVSYIDLGDGNGGIILNISEGGLSVHAVTSLTEDHVPRMRFQLSSSKDWLESSGRVTWTGESRRVVGVKFIDLPESTRAKIQKWIAEESTSGESHQGPSAPSEAELFAVPSATATSSAPESAAAPQSATNPVPRPAPPRATAPTARPAPARPEAKPAPAAPEAARPTEIPHAPAVISVQGPRRPVFSARPLENNSQSAPPASKNATAPAPQYTEPAVRSVPKPAAAPPPTFGLTGQSPSRPLAASPISSPISAPPSAQHPVHKSHQWLLVAVLGFLAGAAVVAGSFAGRAGLKNFIAGVNAKMFTTAEPRVQVSAPRSIGTAAPVSDFEVSDLNGQHRMVSFQASASSSEGNVNHSQQGVPSAHLRPSVPAAQQPPAAEVLASTQPNVSSSSVAIASTGAGQPQNSVAESTQPLSDRTIPGKVIHLVNPIYPETAISEDVEGTVKIRATIAQDGTIVSLQGLSGPDALMDAAMNAVHQWRYAPAVLDGQPVEHVEDISIVFQLPKDKH